jgi:hypothetical protein
MSTSPVQTRVPPTVVTVNEGKAAPNPVQVGSGGQVQFNNNDAVDYIIKELTLQGVVDGQVTLPALGSVTVDIAPGDTSLDYKIVPMNAPGSHPIAESSGGGGRIIINS